MLNDQPAKHWQDGAQRPWMISQHLLGWPCHRPRSYCVMTKDSSCSLSGDGIQTLTRLFRIPAMSVASLFCAPQDSFKTLAVLVLVDMFYKRHILILCSGKAPMQLLGPPSTLHTSEEEVDLERTDAAHKARRSLNSSFENLLTGVFPACGENPVMNHKHIVESSNQN